MVSLSACGLNSVSNEIYLMGCDCLKCLVFKGFACWQAQNEKKVSFVECFLLAIASCCAIFFPVAGRNANNNHDTMKHHPIPSSHFTKLVLRSLSKRGLFITSSFCAPDCNGSFANGQTAYVLSNGKAMPFLAVINLASGKVDA